MRVGSGAGHSSVDIYAWHIADGVFVIRPGIDAVDLAAAAYQEASPVRVLVGGSDLVARGHDGVVGAQHPLAVGQVLLKQRDRLGRPAHECWRPCHTLR